ncbi:MAG: radical SAM protein, partial [Patescibacteria group bacterium]|nr:radical SAM protein [Patescibacteria group bacterium]
MNSYKLKCQNLNVKTITKKSKQESDFVKLLKQIEKISVLEKISFLTSHPKDMGDDLIDWMAKSKKFSHELHLPLQSGDDEILRKMNRNYTASDYRKLVAKIKSKKSSI